MNWVELAFIQACMEESACGFSVCVRTHLSPLRGSCLSHFDPRLTPWALLSRRFAAWDRSVHSTLYAATELSHTHFSPCARSLMLRGIFPQPARALRRGK